MVGNGSRIGRPNSFSEKTMHEPVPNIPFPSLALNVLYRSQSSTTHVTEVVVLLSMLTIFRHCPVVAPAIQSPTTTSNPL